MKKRALSPVVATILLIMIVIIIALLIFLWVRGFISESVTKNGQNIESNCKDVVLSASYNSGSEKLTISNDGNVNVEKIKLKMVEGSDYDTEEIENSRLGIGKTITIENDFEFEFYDKIVVIPVLIGKSDSGNQEFECDERYGTEVEI